MLCGLIRAEHALACGAVVLATVNALLDWNVIPSAPLASFRAVMPCPGERVVQDVERGVRC